MSSGELHSHIYDVGEPSRLIHQQRNVGTPKHDWGPSTRLEYSITILQYQNETSNGLWRTQCTYLRRERVLLTPSHRTTHDTVVHRPPGYHGYNRDHKRIPDVNVTCRTRTDQRRSWFDTNGQGTGWSDCWWYSFHMSTITQSTNDIRTNTFLKNNITVIVKEDNWQRGSNPLPTQLLLKGKSYPDRQVSLCKHSL